MIMRNPLSTVHSGAFLILLAAFGFLAGDADALNDELLTSEEQGGAVDVPFIDLVLPAAVQHHERNKDAPQHLRGGQKLMEVVFEEDEEERRIMAEEACKCAIGGFKKFCIQDVIVFNDPELAEDPFYHAKCF